MHYEPLNHQYILHTLGQWAPCLKRLEILPLIDSTNNYLVGRRHFKGNYAVFAEEQTAGRGRLDHQWISPPGNIYCSLLWHSSSAIHSISELYHVSGQTILHTLHELGVSQAYIKPPNDIFYANKKLGGILIELFKTENGRYDIIIGIGLNLYAPPSQLSTLITQPWIAMNSIAPALTYHRNQLAGLLLKNLLQTLFQIP